MQYTTVVKHSKKHFRTVFEKDEENGTLDAMNYGFMNVLTPLYYPFSITIYICNKSKPG